MEEKNDKAYKKIWTARINKSDWKNMEKFRSDKNLSGKEISNMAGIKHSAYRSYEARTNCIPLKKLIRLSNAMEITIDSFISGEKMPNKKPYTEDDIKHMGKRIRELRKETNADQNSNRIRTYRQCSNTIRT